MSRVKLQLPEKFSFETQIAIRISDINYGGHVGNDSILTLVHEARMQFLNQLGYTEMAMEGSGMIMADAQIEFRAELFYGDVVTVAIKAADFTKIGFSLYYRLQKREAETYKLVAAVKTGMVCYNYDAKKIVTLHDRARQQLDIS